MSKKHFTDLAARLRQLRPVFLTPCRQGSDVSGNAYRQWLDTVESMADFCTSHNPNFNRAAFMSACGINPD